MGFFWFRGDLEFWWQALLPKENETETENENVDIFR